MNNTQLKNLLHSIIEVDKTPEFGYGAKAVNREGKSPPTGSRWLTPIEICKNALRELEEEAYAQDQA